MAGSERCLLGRKNSRKNKETSIFPVSQRGQDCVGDFVGASDIAAALLSPFPALTSCQKAGSRGGFLLLLLFYPLSSISLNQAFICRPVFLSKSHNY